MNYYEPKFLRGVIEKALPVRLFFRTRFFNDQVTFPTETVSFEFASDKRRLLPYTSQYGGSVALERDGYQLKTFRPPVLSGSRVISNATIDQKLIGESSWNSGISPDERARDLALRDVNELQTALFRREEYMCARLKQDGKLIIQGRGVNEEVDYGFENIEDLSASQWTTESDIISKLKEKATLLRKNGVNPDMLILGSKACEALMTNKAVQKLRRDELMNVPPEPSSLEDGVNYVCRLRVPGLILDVYEYLEYYYDTEISDMKPLLDEGTAILQSSKERNMMLYGAVSYIGPDEEYESVMGTYVPYTVTEKDPPLKKLILTSRVLPMPVDIESWYVMKNAA